MKMFLIGQAPFEEHETKPGGTGTVTDAMLEGDAFLGQLRRMFPDITSAGCEFRVLGAEYAQKPSEMFTVVVVFDSQDPASVDAANSLQTRLPMKWDDLARESLARFGHSRFVTHGGLLND